MAYQASINYYGKLIEGGKVRTDVVQNALRQSAEYGQTLVRAITPRRSGRLASGWSVRVVAGGLLWTNQTPYSGYVELGTRHMAGRHMLERAANATRQRFEQQLGRELGTQIATNAIRSRIGYDTIQRGTGGVGFSR